MLLKFGHQSLERTELSVEHGFEGLRGNGVKPKGDAREAVRLLYADVPRQDTGRPFLPASKAVEKLR